MLYIEFTKKCNSRCITCSYWKNQVEERKVTEEDIIKLIRKLPDLRVIIFTGGEATLYSNELFEIAGKIKTIFPHIELRLLTNGINLTNIIDMIQECFQVVVFSFDAANKTTYQKIRGVNAFDKVLDSIKSLHNKGVKIRLRSMILNQNHEELYNIVKLAHSLHVDRISFLPVDDTSSIAFGRDTKPDTQNSFINRRKIIEVLERILHETKWIESGLLPNQGENIKEMILYYKGELTYSFCNAPLTSIVLEMNGNIKGCFFRPMIGNICMNTFDDIISSPLFIYEKFIGSKRKFPECISCVL